METVTCFILPTEGHSKEWEEHIKGKKKPLQHIIDAEKTFDRNQQLLLIKIQIKTWLEGNHLNINV